MIFNLGAPSQLDTWDMKPDAPAEIRGPFKPISTNAPDIQISEIFPLHAKLADKFSLVRSCYHTAAGGARHRASDDADRPALHRRRQHAARRLRGQLSARPADRPAGPRAPARADGPHRRRPVARPGRRLPGQGLRSVRADGRSVEAEFQGARPAAAAADRRGPARAPPQAARCGRRHGQAVRGQRRRQAAWTPISRPPSG